jgi:hypothetical protein
MDFSGRNITEFGVNRGCVDEMRSSFAEHQRKMSRTIR